MVHEPLLNPGHLGLMVIRPGSHAASVFLDTLPSAHKLDASIALCAS